MSASASVPTNSRVTPVDADELPPKPANAPQPRVYGRAAQPVAPEAGDEDPADRSSDRFGDAPVPQATDRPAGRTSASARVAPPQSSPFGTPPSGPASPFEPQPSNAGSPVSGGSPFEPPRTGSPAEAPSSGAGFPFDPPQSGAPQGGAPQGGAPQGGAPQQAGTARPTSGGAFSPPRGSASPFAPRDGSPAAPGSPAFPAERDRSPFAAAPDSGDRPFPTAPPRSSFGAPADDSPFGAQAEKPFGPPSDQPFSAQPEKPFGAPNDSSPFGAPGKNAPFGPPTNQTDRPPFGAQTDSSPFGAQTDRPPFGAPADRPPFGAKADNPPFGAPADNPPFGAPADSPPFGSPADSPPFGSPAERSPFGAPPRAQGGPPSAASFSELTTDVSGRGRGPAPDQYGEHTTDISGRGRGPEQPYVPAPALSSMHAAPPLENGFPGEVMDQSGRTFSSPSSRATVTPPGPDQTSSWPGVTATGADDPEASRFDQFKPEAEAPAAKPETPHVRMLPIVLAVIVGAALVVGLAIGTVWLISRGSDSSSAFDVKAGECVAKNGTNSAVRAGCGDAGAFQVASVVATPDQCADRNQPYVSIAGDEKNQARVLCLKPVG